MLPGLRQGFLKFCLKYEPDYLPLMKESFLLSTILENLFEEEIPSFDPIKSKDNLHKFIGYKQDFQKDRYIQHIHRHYLQRFVRFCYYVPMLLLLFLGRVLL